MTIFLSHLIECWTLCSAWMCIFFLGHRLSLFFDLQECAKNCLQPNINSENFYPRLSINGWNVSRNLNQEEKNTPSFLFFFSLQKIANLWSKNRAQKCMMILQFFETLFFLGKKSGKLHANNWRNFFWMSMKDCNCPKYSRFVYSCTYLKYEWSWCLARGIGYYSSSGIVWEMHPWKFSHFFFCLVDGSQIKGAPSLLIIRQVSCITNQAFWPIQRMLSKPYITGSVTWTTYVKCVNKSKKEEKIYIKKSSKKIPGSNFTFVPTDGVVFNL